MVDYARWLRNTPWGDFADYLSPAAFKILSLSDMQREAMQLARDFRDREKLAEVRQRVAETLRRAELPVWLDPDRSDDLPSDVAPPPRGQTVLRLYFHQLFAHEELLLDLRGSRFEERAGGYEWHPRGLIGRFPADFLEPVRGLYLGFYRDDDATFRASLRALNLSVCEDLFREQFGQDDQRAVSFDLKFFQSTFHGIFVRCRDEGVRLHGSFVAFGLYLIGLYDHLSRLGEPQDVRTAFDAVTAKLDRG